jgi:hypothetical protein
VRGTFRSDSTEQRLVRKLCHNIFDLEKDDDFLHHVPANKEIAATFNLTPDDPIDSDDEIEGPQSEDLRVDMNSPPSSLWNQEVVRILLSKFNAMGEDERQMHQATVKEILEEKLVRLRKNWRSANARYKEDGAVETVEEIEARLDTTGFTQLQRNRRKVRRARVSRL